MPMEGVLSNKNSSLRVSPGSEPLIFLNTNQLINKHKIENKIAIEK